jgi:hypothetical protein
MEKQKRKNDDMPLLRSRWKSYVFRFLVVFEITAIVVIGLFGLYMDAAAPYIFKDIVRCTLGMYG